MPRSWKNFMLRRGTRNNSTGPTRTYQKNQPLAINSDTEKHNKNAAVLESVAKNKTRAAIISVMGFLGAGAVGGAAAIGIASPAGPVIVGTAMAVAFCMQLYARNKELRIALTEVYDDLKRINLLYRKIQTVAKANPNIKINDSLFKSYLDKILKYIMLLVPKDKLGDLLEGRSVNAQSTIMSRMGSYFSPADYIQILLNDFTRLMGSFTILYLEVTMNDVTPHNLQSGVTETNAQSGGQIDSDAVKALIRADADVNGTLESQALKNDIEDVKQVAEAEAAAAVGDSSNPSETAAAAKQLGLLSDKGAQTAVAKAANSRPSNTPPPPPQQQYGVAEPPITNTPPTSSLPVYGGSPTGGKRNVKTRRAHKRSKSHRRR